MTAILRFAILIVVKIVKFVYDCIKLIFAKYGLGEFMIKLEEKEKKHFVDYDNQYNAIKTTIDKEYGIQGEEKV